MTWRNWRDFAALEKAKKAVNRSTYKLRRLWNKFDFILIGSEASNITGTSYVREQEEWGQPA